MKLYQHFIFIVALLFVSNQAIGNNTIYEEANKLYDEKKYNEAAQKYQSLIDEGKIADDVYYNLGNAHYKGGNLAAAILNYERALKINPDHEDAAFNLKIANAKTIDKVETLPSLFIENTWQSFVVSNTIKTWSNLSLWLFFFGAVMIIAYLFFSSIILKKIGFYSGGILFVAALFAWLMAYAHQQHLQNNSEAIVFASVSTVLSEPNETSNKLFTIHEGLKVSLLEEKEEWAKIKIQNGNVGWVKAEDLEEL